MRFGRRSAAIGATVVALSALAAGGVVAATQSSDETALQPTRQAASKEIEKRVSDLLAQMTLNEKVQQLKLLADFQARENDSAAIRNGAGSVFGVTDAAEINKMQHIAVEQTRLHIPLLFAFDTIHGFRTIFPIPLGEASSFDPDVARTSFEVAASESAAVGLKQIYAPMVDVSHEPRWGRIAEGGGEDPYLGSVMAAARVKGAQGTDYSAPDKVATSPKHYAAYGQPEGGRDYNTTDMSEQRLRNLYLPPFKAAVDVGADTAMCSFNAINGVPGCGNRYLETDVLKGEWKFDGFIESDWTAVAEMRACPPQNPNDGPCGHGVAADGPDAARIAINAGTDMEMVSRHYDSLPQLIADGKVSMARLDDAVKRILRVKFRAGLFEHPYVDVDAAPSKILTPENRAAARDVAGRSMVLLENEGSLLPLSNTKSTVVIGPLADNKHHMLGPWWGRGDAADVVSVFEGMKAQNPNTTFVAGCTFAEWAEPPNNTPADECGGDDVDWSAAVAAAAAAEQVVVAVGEPRERSGEAAGVTDIDLPGRQQELIDQVAALGKPFVVVLFNGRPLTLGKVSAKAPAILEAWFPGVEAGNAVADVLFGAVNPGGKLPVSFPQRVGQVPIYYNHEPTGRPCNPNDKWNSRYRDLKTCDPLYEFGFGLSYTTFQLSNLRLNRRSMPSSGSVNASVTVTNTGGRKGDEVVQLYINDPVASISQPVRRLRGFERVTLAPGASDTVTFRLDASDVGFFDNSGHFVVEPGQIKVWASTSSKGGLEGSFTVTG